MPLTTCNKEARFTMCRRRQNTSQTHRRVDNPISHGHYCTTGCRTRECKSLQNSSTDSKMLRASWKKCRWAKTSLQAWFTIKNFATSVPSRRVATILVSCRATSFWTKTNNRNKRLKPCLRTRTPHSDWLLHSLISRLIGNASRASKKTYGR